MNLSARQFSGGTLLARLDELVAQHGIDPSLMELEITETAAMRDPEATRLLLRQLRTRGFKLAIDDFGTGYSSLAYLKRLPLDTVKIDRSFIIDIPKSPQDMEIVQAIIVMAHTLHLKVVTEGVETPAQLEFLSEYGCDYVQGYLFSKPAPLSELRPLVQQLNLRRPSDLSPSTHMLDALKLAVENHGAQLAVSDVKAASLDRSGAQPMR